MCVVRTHAVFLNYFPSYPNQRSSETHFQTTFCHFAKQEFPPPSPQTSPEPVNFPCFNNFLEVNHVQYLPTPLISAPHRRTRSAVFSAGQSWCCPQNFRRALSGGGVQFGKLFGMVEASRSLHQTACVPSGTHPTCNPTKPVCRVCTIRTHAVFFKNVLSNQTKGRRIRI